MKYSSLFLILFGTAQCFGCGYKRDNKILNETVDTTKNIQQAPLLFKYRDILEEAIDTASKDDYKKLFGSWQISSIASVGGTIYPDSIIFKEIGQVLYIDSNRYSFRFMDKSFEVLKPDYKIELWSEKAGYKMKGTTFFHGYRQCRNAVVMMNISKKIYFEIINYQEMAYYSLGRIYFFTRQN